VGDREWRVRNDAEFGRATRLISEAKVLGFAGAYEAAANRLERSRARFASAPRSTPQELDTTENDLGLFKGLRQQVGLRDRFSIEIFQGLDEAVFGAMVSDEVERTDEELWRFRKRSSRGIADVGTKLMTSLQERGSVVVRSAAPDGSFFEVRVSEP
jgi:hypothetical protein